GLYLIRSAGCELCHRRGRVLKQPQNSPMPVEEQVVVVFAGTKGYLDSLPVGDVRRFENELLDYMRTTHGALLSGMRRDPKADVPAELGDMIVEFKERFVAANAEAARLA